MVSFTVSEGQDEVPHVITKNEAEARLHYIDEQRKGYTFAREPVIRKHDYVFNGKLRLTIHPGIYYRDTETERIEDKLGDILISLVEESEYVRINRLKAEEDARQAEIRRQEALRKKEEEDRLYEERRQRYNNEVEKTIALINKANDYQIACKIRALVNAMSDISEPSKELQEYITWALGKADWFDPTIANKDTVLGIRKHELSEKDKALEKVYGRYGW